MADDDVEVKYAIKYDGDEATKEFVSQDGRASATFANGDSYDGQYESGKRHGQGVYKWAAAKPAQYNGTWNKGERVGQGVMTFPDNSQYDGEWAEGKFQGRGIYLYRNGDRFIGQFEGGIKHGEGTYVYGDDGSMIKGRWIQGKLVSGQWTTKDGTKMSGAFTDNVPNGEVHFVFPNGNQQNGTFENGHWQAGEIESWQ